MADPAAPEKTASAPPREEPTFLQRLRSSPITFGLAALNVAVFLWASMRGSTMDSGTLLAFGAVEPLHVWAGEYWRVATCMFLHIGWVHLLWNTYASIGWSASIERALGKRRFLLVYLVSGVGAGCASVASGIIFGPKLSAGASGAMFGIIGATLAIRRRQLPSFAAFVADKGIRSTFVNIAIWTAIGLTALRMDNSAHFGGLVVGFAATWLLTSRAPRNGWLLFAAALAALFVVAARPWWSPSGKHAGDIAVYADSYLTGKDPHGDANAPAWPVNVARGLRFAEKGCAHGVARACEVLADHLDRTGDAAALPRAADLHRRACEMDVALCPTP